MHIAAIAGGGETWPNGRIVDIHYWSVSSRAVACRTSASGTSARARLARTAPAITRVATTHAAASIRLFLPYQPRDRRRGQRQLT